MTVKSPSGNVFTPHRNFPHEKLSFDLPSMSAGYCWYGMILSWFPISLFDLQEETSEQGNRYKAALMFGRHLATSSGYIFDDGTP